MEEQNTKSKIWKHVAMYSVLIIITLVSCCYGVYSFIEKDKKIETLQFELQSNVNEKSSCFSLRDSLKRENNRLYVYKPLTKAMLHRDEATKQLKYGIGDVVMLKVDSSRVVIEDVIIGGGNFDYYIRYSVLHKDRSAEIVSPDLIY